MNKICPICNIILIADKSESGIAGACGKCRDEIIPQYVSLPHHSRYVRLYLKKKSYEQSQRVAGFNSR